MTLTGEKTSFVFAFDQSGHDSRSNQAFGLDDAYRGEELICLSHPPDRTRFNVKLLEVWIRWHLQGRRPHLSLPPTGQDLTQGQMARRLDSMTRSRQHSWRSLLGDFSSLYIHSVFVLWINICIGTSVILHIFASKSRCWHFSQTSPYDIHPATTHFVGNFIFKWVKTIFIPHKYCSCFYTINFFQLFLIEREF